ncbi:hypothetical protein H3H30_gp04 [Stx converting phage vB_EcoS_P27]|uniref:Uncharacterized protein n=1 Tax=Stx converting phage vB_EcoS_P27 TaxID=1792287 RepID=A0A1I9LJ41_9CAUD|nr:hypothetical protein H3H30_gp04 [Stx converting phage vB_EcoS_P27]ANJ65572.1 hypothetical protein vBEcoSP27_04 [Stx converting phage vB_EcoS_P27]
MTCYVNHGKKRAAPGGNRNDGRVHVRRCKRVIEAENINDCYDHWMIWAQIAHAEVTNIRIEELKEHQAA